MHQFVYQRAPRKSVMEWITRKRGANAYKGYIETDKAKEYRQNRRCKICMSSAKKAKLFAEKEDAEEFICAQCRLFEELDMTDENNVAWSKDRFDHLVSALLPSPITWLRIASLGPSSGCMWAMIVTNVVVVILSKNLINPKVTHKGPFSVTKQNHLKALHWIQYLVNIIFFGEIVRQSIFSGGNVVHECDWENFREHSDAPPANCLLYLDLLGNSFIVYFCSLFVNVACLRTLEEDGCSASWSKGLFKYQSFPEIWNRRMRPEDEIKTVTLLSEFEAGKERNPYIVESLKLALQDVRVLGKQEIKSIGFACGWLKMNCKNCVRDCCTKVEDQNAGQKSNTFARNLVLFVTVWLFTCMSIHLNDSGFYNIESE